MRIATLLSAAAIILISGCAGRPHPVDTTTTSTSLQTTDSKRESTSDSTVIRDRLTFQPVAVPADSAGLNLQLEQASDGTIKPVSSETHGKGGASAQVHVTADGKARIICRCDAWRDSVATLTTTVTRLRRQSSARDSIVYRDRWHVRTVVREVPRPVAWFDWGARGLAVLLLLGLLIALILIISYHRHHRQYPESDDDLH